MVKSFIAWLDSYISREGPSSVLKALVGLLAFAGLLGTLFGNQAIRAGAFVVTVVFVASSVLLLLADRRRLQRGYDVHRELLTRYCDFVIDNSTEPLVSIENWTQRVYVSRNGDVRESLTLRTVALREEVYFIRLKAGSTWDQPDKYRRNVQVIARTLTVNGVCGPRWNVTTSWISAQKMTLNLHLHQAIKYGEEILFEVVKTWPAKCLPLMRKGEAETFSFQTTSLLEVRRVDYSVILPVGFDAVYEPIGASDPSAGLSIEAQDDQEGRRVFRLRAGQVPTMSMVGMRLELK